MNSESPPSPAAERPDRTTSLAPWTAGPFVIGHFDEINGAASRRRHTEISVFEARMLARHWAGQLAEVEALWEAHCSGSWEIRMHPYASCRLRELVEAGLLPPEERIQLMNRARRLAGLRSKSFEIERHPGAAPQLHQVEMDERSVLSTGRSLWEIRAALDETVQLELEAEMRRQGQQSAPITHFHDAQSAGQTAAATPVCESPFHFPPRWRLFHLDMSRVLLPCHGLNVRKDKQMVITPARGSNANRAGWMSGMGLDELTSRREDAFALVGAHDKDFCRKHFAANVSRSRWTG